jgi:hypothetical protein
MTTLIALWQSLLDIFSGAIANRKYRYMIIDISHAWGIVNADYYINERINIKVLSEMKHCELNPLKMFV